MLQILRILLVDNDEDYRKSLRIVLEAEKFREFHIEEASSVNEATEKLEGLPIDVALVDLHLTKESDILDVSGFDVAKQALRKGIPCIIVTALPSLETMRLALHFWDTQPPAVNYVLKQDSPQAILDAIQNLCGLTLLHISDLHPKLTPERDAPFNQEQAFDEFLKDVTAQPGLALHPLQAIVVSGDISFQCQKESFNQARHWLTTLAQELKVPLKHIVLAPGNHDVNRAKARATEDTLVAMHTRNMAWFSKFDEFLDFTTYFYGEPAFSPNKLYRIFEFDGRLTVVAFNSCLVDGDADRVCAVCMEKKRKPKEHYHGWINRAQVKQAGEDLDLQGWNGLRIAVFHHHVVAEDWQPKDRCRGDHLMNYDHPDHLLKLTFDEWGFRILLHGHRHKAGLRQPPVLGASEPYSFGSGMFWKSNDNQHETANYLLLQLAPGPDRSRVIMREYNPATSLRPGYWDADSLIRREGIIPLRGLSLPVGKLPSRA